MRLVKYRIGMDPFDFAIEYIKGATNHTADVLSRLILDTVDEAQENDDLIICNVTREMICLNLSMVFDDSQLIDQYHDDS